MTKVFSDAHITEAYSPEQGRRIVDIKHDYEVLFYNSLPERCFALTLKGVTAVEIELRIATVIINQSYSSYHNDHIKSYSVRYEEKVNEGK